MTVGQVAAQLIIERANPIGGEIHGLPRLGDWGRGMLGPQDTARALMTMVRC